MERIGSIIHERLMAQGIANGLAGRPRLRGIGAGLREGADRPATAQPEGDTGNRWEWEKMPEPKPRQVGQEALEVERYRLNGGHMRNTAIHNFVVHTNHAMSDMPMRQTTQTPRAVAPRGVVSLMVIVGGKR